MRNLKEYPVTKAEIIALLDTLASEEEADLAIGGVNGLLLRQAIQHVAYSQAPTNELGLIFLDYTKGNKDEQRSSPSQ